MKTPNSTMKNLLSGPLCRAPLGGHIRVSIYSGGPLTLAERSVINAYTSSAFVPSHAVAMAELNKTRSLALSMNSTDARQVCFGSQMSIGLSQIKFNILSQTNGVTMGLMLIHIGTGEGSSYVSMVLTLGLEGSGADVELSSLVYTSNMPLVFNDLILNFV